MPALPAERSETSVVSYDRWRPEAEALHREFVAGQPMPFLVLDDFLEPAVAREALECFPSIDDDWTHYLHYNERKYGMNDRRQIPLPLLAIIDELNGEPFVSLLRRITGIADLRNDDTLEGGGLHQGDAGCFVNLHADFTVHPHQPTWRRRLNFLIYLNPGWDESWGGHLELWDAGVKHCVHKIAPVFNRAVLFQTDETSFHGFPDPTRCPSDVTRKSIALYSFAEEANRPRAISTEYRARPGDGARRIPIYVDKMALRAYDAAKRIFGIDDSFANGVLRRIGGRRRGKS